MMSIVSLHRRIYLELAILNLKGPILAVLHYKSLIKNDHNFFNPEFHSYYCSQYPIYFMILSTSKG